MNIPVGLQLTTGDLLNWNRHVHEDRPGREQALFASSLFMSGLPFNQT